MTPRQAHLHLMETTPRERITTHTREFFQARPPGRRYGEGRLPQALADEYSRMKMSGATYDQIRTSLQVGPSTIQRLALETGK